MHSPVAGNSCPQSYFPVIKCHLSCHDWIISWSCLQLQHFYCDQLWVFPVTGSLPQYSGKRYLKILFMQSVVYPAMYLASSGTPVMLSAIAGKRQVLFFWSPPPVTQHNGVLTNYTILLSLPFLPPPVPLSPEHLHNSGWVLSKHSTPAPWLPGTLRALDLLYTSLLPLLKTVKVFSQINCKSSHSACTQMRFFNSSWVDYYQAVLTLR